MTARAVPPPGQTPFPFRELTFVARRNLTRGLTMSALAHLALLSAILVSQEREPALRLVRGTVAIVPHHPVVVPPAPAIDTPSPPAIPTDVPAWKPVERILFEPPKTAVPSGNGVDRRDGPGSPPGREPGVDTGARSVTEADLPAEGVFVYFDEPPVPVHRPPPEYPAWARENGITGKVLLRVLVDPQGNVRRVSVVRGVEGLTEAAQEALRRWTFRPATTNGRPVAVWVEIPVEFRLD
ncbi:MAG TPA: TonB family protein [Candidatus Eisenbacteria bacterium]|nr:TonB family protein [Candidatus Eisenbacteria bacterium]